MNTVTNFVIGDSSYDGVSRAIFTRELFERRFKYERSFEIKAEAVAPDFDEIIFSSRGSRGRIDDVGLLNGVLVKLYAESNSENRAYIYAAGESEEAIKAASETMKPWFTPVEVTNDKVIVNFWSLSANGPRTHQRKIEVPSWEDISQNYSRYVSEEFGRVVDRNFDSTEGKLVLWYGPPGSGKSFAIRAVMRGWKKTSFEYIVDPERFFGSNPDYMLDVILNGSNAKAKLLILEDTGELLSADAKHRSGQGLSRLLNVADGLIGQGVNLTILLTTNEELGSFHPAVVRPGRCLSKVEVGPLSVMESVKWLRDHGSSAKVSEPKTLAELYAILNNTGDYSDEEPVAIGQYI